MRCQLGYRQLDLVFGRGTEFESLPRNQKESAKKQCWINQIFRLLKKNQSVDY